MSCTSLEYEKTCTTNVCKARYGENNYLLYESENFLMMFGDALRVYVGRFSSNIMEHVEFNNISRAAGEVREGCAWRVRCVLTVGQKPISPPELFPSQVAERVAVQGPEQGRDQVRDQVRKVSIREYEQVMTF